MRSFSGIVEIKNAEELLSFMKEDPKDRVLKYSCDLDPNDFDGACATRTDGMVIVVCSLKEVGAKNVEELCDNLLRQGCQFSPLKGEIAVIGSKDVRDRFGRVTPPCIEKMLRDAENQVIERQLSWCGYDGICVLPEHPEAEK